MAATLVFRAMERRPISSRPDSSTETVRSFSARPSNAAVAARSGGAIRRVSTKPMKAHRATMTRVMARLTQVARLDDWAAARASSLPNFAFRSKSWFVASTVSENF